MDPMQLWTEGLSNCATTSTKENPVLLYHVDTDTSVTGKTVLAHTPASSVQGQLVLKVDPHPGKATSLVDPNKDKLSTQGQKAANKNHSDPVPDINNYLNFNPSSNSQVVTPIDIDRLKQALANHPDRSFVDTLCSELQEGAHIGYEGPRTPKFSHNLPSAKANPEIVDENLAKEVSMGRTAGPFATPPFTNFQVSPIGLVPKKHTGKFRTIFHLSYPKSSDSINSFIDKDNFSLQYVTIDRVIHAILKLGQGCFLAKTDIEAAFRQYPVHPDDWELLGMCWRGKYYFDKVLPFGLRSAPFKFNTLSAALEWIALVELLITFVDHILGDFIIGEATEAECSISLQSLLIMFRNLGVPIAPRKTVKPTQIIEFIGIVLDSVKLEARLPQDKVEHIKEALSEWECKKTCTLKELQSLIGTLNFACKVVPPGRPFLQRMIALTKGIQKPHYHVRLNNGFWGGPENVAAIHSELEWDQHVHERRMGGF